MDTDATRPEPGDDLTAAGADADVVDAIALEAVTAAEAPPEDDAAPILDDSDPMVGRRLGAYRLLERIGGGATGSVYLAGSLGRRFAVHRIERASEGEAIVRRFRDAARIQAALGEHPHIAGLIDAGTDEEGRPYLVTEYVEGRPIEEYGDAQRLDVPARLRLFAQVGDAIQFAHRLGVIHGELEPGQILVTDDGVPRLIGLGVAGLIDPGGVASAASPEYASPEQVLGGPPATASDVYAMGVLLYRLVTGRRPYRLASEAVDEVYQAICEQAPERPSRAVLPRRRPIRPGPEPDPSPLPASIAEPAPEEVAAARGTTPRRLTRALAGDLDAIILMAMRKEPERRYASAGQLADDLRRHLDGRPVRARSDSSAYRLGKFVRRNPAVIAAALLLVLATAGGVIGITRTLLRAQRRRDRAEASSVEARGAVDRLLAGVIEDRRLDQPGMQPTRDELLRDARGFYEGWVAEGRGDPSELAGARARLGRIAAKIGPPAQADDQLRQAIAIWEDALRSHPDDREVQQQLARALDDRGALLMRTEGRRDEALDACRRAVAILEPLAADGAASPRRALGSALLHVTRIQADRGRPREAMESLRRAVEIEELLAVEDPRAIEPRIALAGAYGLLSRILMDQPDGLATTLSSARRAVEHREAVVRDRPELADQSYQLALDLGDLSTAQQMAGQLDSALAVARRAVEVLERLDRQHPGVLDYLRGLGGGYNLTSDLHRHRGEPAESLAAAEKARALFDRLVAEHPDDVPTRVALARSHANIGRAQQQSSDPVEALRSLGRAVDLLDGLPHLDARAAYDLAGDLSLCIPLVGAKPGTQGADDDEALSQVDQLRRKLYGDRAIEVLRRAARDGSLDAESLQSDPDLAPIRRRDDFRQIVQDLQKRAADRP